MIPPCMPVTARNCTSTSLEMTLGPPRGRTDLRTFVAWVPFGLKACEAVIAGWLVESSLLAKESAINDYRAP